MSTTTQTELAPVTDMTDGTTSQEADACPQCGISPAVRLDEQSRITELQAEVKILSNKASDAGVRIAGYEDELRKLKSSQPLPPQRQPSDQSVNGTDIPPAQGEQQQTPPASADDTSKALSPAPAAGQTTTLQHRPSIKNRFPSFLTRSASVRPAQSIANVAAAAAAASVRENELAEQLQQERSLRTAAEGKMSQMSTEMEDLSVTLFQQANEMVASERQARAKLEERAARFEERCGVLEEKVRVLEKRDTEKKKRLEKLEVGLARIDRINKLLDVRWSPQS